MIFFEYETIRLFNECSKVTEKRKHYKVPSKSSSQQRLFETMFYFVYKMIHCITFDRCLLFKIRVFYSGNLFPAVTLSCHSRNYNFGNRNVNRFNISLIQGGQSNKTVMGLNSLEIFTTNAKKKPTKPTAEIQLDVPIVNQNFQYTNERLKLKGKNNK